jgi:hypothetical protein
MPLHVDQLHAVADPSRINTAVGDARDLDLDDSAADAVLLGPIYHLRRRDQRLRALREAWRVVRCSLPPSPAGRRGWTASCDCGSTSHCRRSASRSNGRAHGLDAARATERVPELLGPHLLATAVRPER